MVTINPGTGDHGRHYGRHISKRTPEQVAKSIVDGINTGNLDALMTLYEPEAAFARQPGSLAHGLAGSVNHWLRSLR